MNEKLVYFLKNFPMEWPKEYAKPILVVPDSLVETFRNAYGDMARVVPISETMLPITIETASEHKS